VRKKVMTMLRRRAIVFLFAALMAWPATYLIFRDWGNWEFVRVPGREYWIDHAADGFAGGSGGSGDPYVIETAEQLALVAKRVNGGGAKGAHFHISKDIDLSGRDWVPIGTRENPFSGHLESTGAVVSNLTIRGDRDGQGLVGVMEHGMLASVTLESVDVEGRDRVGGLVGDGDYTHIENCGVSGSVRGRDRVGGLAGYLDWNFCKFNLYRGEVAGREEVGGLIGRWARESRKWSGCEGGMASANVQDVWKTTLIGFSGVVGHVSGERWVGGIVGYVTERRNFFRNPSFMGKVSDRHHDSMVALIGGIKGKPQEAIKEMPSYELFKYGSGTLLLLREGGLFVRVDGENDEAKEVRIPGEEGPAILRAVVSGQVPEGIASSDRVRYIEVKRAVEVYELGSVPLDESGYSPMAMFFTGGYFTVEGDRFRVLSMEGLGGIYAPRGLYCVPCVKRREDGAWDAVWVLIRVV